MTAYYNENDPFAAQWLKNMIAENLITPGEVDDRSIRDVRPSDLGGFTINATFSPASADGPMQPDLLDGLMSGLCGREVVRAKAKAAQASGLAKTTRDTSGRRGSRLSKPADPLSSWESRLRERLQRIGSTECVLTWKTSATPCKRPLSRLVPSMRPTGETDFGLYATPATRDYRFPNALPLAERGGGKKGEQLPNQVAHKILGLWGSPKYSDYRPGLASRAMTSDRVNLNDQTHGAVQDGSWVPTGKPGGLNPAFVSWLMGFPPEWVSCAPSATLSCRKLRPK